MALAAVAFVILLTFVPGSGHGADRRIINCKDEACVENVIKHAPESRYLTRLRVFSEYRGYLTGGETVFPALQDLTFD